ncbi:hypothetical protein QOZ94_004367, partial [Xanthobacter agilis]|nr:hypothetical protein [Xanthobacter agilis]
QSFSDGSQILGSATFVRNGKTQAAADGDREMGRAA